MRLHAKILLVICILSLLGTGALAWRSFKILFTSFPYQYNQDILDVKVQLQNNSAGDSAINVAFNLNEDIDDMTMDFVVAIESDDGNYTALVNRSLNFCKFLKQRSAEPLLRLVYEDMLKHGNFIKSCPVKKGAYSMHEYRVDEEMLPSYVPETSFFLKMALNQNGKYLFKGTLHGKIDKSKGFNNLKMFSLG